MNILRIIKVPDIATIANALLGVSAIFMAILGNVTLALIMILLSCIADGLDGYLALHLENSQIGKYLDSLADAISFGVAPVVIIFTIYGPEYRLLMVSVLLLYIACGILRLARFDTKQSKIPDFEGVPITASAVMISSYLLMSPQYVHPYILIFLLVVLSLLMITTYPYPKLRGIRLLLPISVIFGLVILSAAISHNYATMFATLLFLLMALYLESPIMQIPRKYYRD